MKKNIQTILNYHNQTKHSQKRYARSLGYMDWETQPNPFRVYEGSKKVKLRLSFENNTLEYSQIFQNNTPKAPLCLESISQFFQFSLGLAAIKEYQGTSWALRCNASSGNLHPTESYLIASNIENIPDALYHYNSSEHELERIREAKDLKLPKDSFLVALSSIVWREAWKYGERSYRYTQLDCGHAIKSLEISAKTLGWSIKAVNIKDESLDKLLGYKEENRYLNQEKEESHLLLLISKEEIKEFDSSNLLNSFSNEYEGEVNQLSYDWHDWPILESIEKACKKDDESIFVVNNFLESNYRKESFLAKDVILKRRSAQMMNEDNSQITKEEFQTILASIKSKTSAIHLVIFVHNVKDLDKGLYFLKRDEKEEFKTLFKEDFIWEKVETNAGELYKLKEGSYKFLAKAISCNQDIASQSAFSLGMLAKFEEELEQGNHRYKELYWECGAIGQQLYLEATSLNLSATGIGCFLDDIVHDTLGINNFSYQSLYHFTIGRAIVDTRLTDKKPYGLKD